MSRRMSDPFVVTGVSLGLPGGEGVFNEDTFERLVRGETCISEVTDEYKQRLLDKNLVRLIKGRDGSVNMDQATEFGDVPQLAGVKGAFDLAEEFGIDPKVILAWDITTQLGTYLAVEKVGRTLGDQIWLHEGAVPELRAVTDAVHAKGGKIAAQITHGGSFVTGIFVPRRLQSSVSGFNPAGLWAH